jgi:hypothetical protein
MDVYFNSKNSTHYSPTQSATLQTHVGVQLPRSLTEDYDHTNTMLMRRVHIYVKIATLAQQFQIFVSFSLTLGKSHSGQISGLFDNPKILKCEDKNVALYVISSNEIYANVNQSSVAFNPNLENHVDP